MPHLTSILFPFLALGILGSCRESGDASPVDDAEARDRMVREQIEARGVRDPAVLRAMRKVPRREFVPVEVQRGSHQDHPLPIGEAQTISQPYIVALMTELARLRPGDMVLEIGTGSGYQAAVLAEIVGPGSVFTIEILPELAKRARATLSRLGYEGVQIRQGDGYEGWPERGPFDAIVVTAAPRRVPEPLLAQLKEGGRLVIPVGEFNQELMVYTRTEKGLRQETILPVRFVPMTGKAQVH